MSNCAKSNSWNEEESIDYGDEWEEYDDSDYDSQVEADMLDERVYDINGNLIETEDKTSHTPKDISKKETT